MSHQSRSRSRSSSRSSTTEYAPEKVERKRGMRKGLYVFNALLTGVGDIALSEMVKKVSEEVFKTTNISTCVDEQSIKQVSNNVYECIMIVDRMGQHSEISTNRLSGFKDDVSWSLVEAKDVENWKEYYKTVSCRGCCQVGTPLNNNARIVDIFRKALQCKSISQCKSLITKLMDPLEMITYQERIMSVWSENYKRIRGERKIGNLYPVDENSGCITAIKNWIKDVFLGPQSRPKALFIIGETRTGKSMTVSNFLMEKEWIEYQAFDISAKEKYGLQNVFRILDDATFGIHKVDVLKMYLNNVDSTVNVKYGESVVVPIPTIVMLNKMSFIEILRDFSDKKWLGGNIVVYPEQTEETFTSHLVYESNIAEMVGKIYDETKPLINDVKWEDTLFYKALNITKQEFNSVYNNMKVGDDIWSEVRRYMLSRNTN